MAKKSNHSDSKLFEDAYQRLETIVKELDEGKLKLDEIEQRFEEGMKMAVFCTNRLEQVEKKVNLLIEDAKGQLDRKPLTLDNEE